VPNCTGAVVQGVVSEGRLVDVIIQSAGWGASWGIGILTESGDVLATHDGKALKGVEYDAIELDVGPPDPGGIQARAYVNFSVTPMVRRAATVSLGEDYVRLFPSRLPALLPDEDTLLIAENGDGLITQSSLPIAIDPPVVEVGMEAIGEYIPLNSFVTRIDGPRVYLSHPDGSPVSLLHGATRTVEVPAGWTLIEGVGSVALMADSNGNLRANGTLITISSGNVSKLKTPPPPQSGAVNYAVNLANGFTAVAAESLDGLNTLFWRFEPSGHIYLWRLDKNWQQMYEQGPILNGTQEYLDLETRLGVDLGNDGLAGTAYDWRRFGGSLTEVRFYKPFRTHIPFRMATGVMQLINEDSAKGGDGLVDRSVTLVYTPTPSDKEVEIIERFNGRDEMRANIARRDRGGPGGFVHRQDSASTVLNTSREASHLGFATGVARAKFASRVYTDMTGEDQHLQVELYGRPEQASPWKRNNFWNADPSIRTPQRFVLHSMTVNGVVEDAE
jgi:hypothetical protein